MQEPIGSRTALGRSGYHPEAPEHGGIPEVVGVPCVAPQAGGEQLACGIQSECVTIAKLGFRYVAYLCFEGST